MGFLGLLLLVILMIPLLSIVLDSSLGRALANRLERGERGGGVPEILQERIVYLEGEVDRLSDEVRRLDEEGRFMQQLLSDRQERRSLPGGEEPGDASADGDDRD